MKTKLYLEGASGISGDMMVGALLDLGASHEILDNVLKSLDLDGFDYTVSHKKSHGIGGCDFDVRLHAHEHGHGHSHSHESEHEHTHVHEHRNLTDVCKIIDRGVMSERARMLAKKIFGIVAEAEAKAHQCPVEEVHFHEVGAIDSIVDIVATAVLIDDLGIEACVVTGLNEGHGLVRCQHGDLPVPVPAVLNIAQAHRIPLRPTKVHGEMVTPTGIAIAAALRTADKLPEKFTIDKIGIGLGKRDFGHANILRALLITEDETPPILGDVYVLETNMDDVTGEMLGLAMEKLLKAGAYDVHYIPCFMKKNRPGYLLRIITEARYIPELERILFESTTTIGVRRTPVERTCMSRRIEKIKLAWGEVEIKKCSFEGITRSYPEYESVKKISEESGIDFQTVFNAAKQACEERK